MEVQPLSGVAECKDVNSYCVTAWHSPGASLIDVLSSFVPEHQDISLGAILQCPSYLLQHSLKQPVVFALVTKILFSFGAIEQYE